jgi:hypothetical protein
MRQVIRVYAIVALVAMGVFIVALWTHCGRGLYPLGLLVLSMSRAGKDGLIGP